LRYAHERSGSIDQRIESPLHTASPKSNATTSVPERPALGRGRAPSIEPPTATATKRTADPPIQTSESSAGPCPKKRTQKRSEPTAARLTAPPTPAARMRRR